MEALDQAFGYIYYQSQIGKTRPIKDFRLIECMDRAQIFINDNHLAIQYDLEIGQKLEFEATWQSGQPAFYQFTLNASTIGDTFIDLEGW
jgi:beta-galactosidase